MSQKWAELLMEDHSTTEKVFEAVIRALGNPDGPNPDLIGKAAEYFSVYVDKCHNKKEEEHLFPLIEQRGIPRDGGPLAVMLQEHEQSRGMLARLRPLAERYAAGDREVLTKLKKSIYDYAELLKQHFWKENDILYPMAQRVVSEADQETIIRGIETAEAALGADTRAKYYALAAEIVRAGEVKDLAYNLDHATIAAIFNTLPVELSFVDADDTVRYFSHENQTKIFPRTRGAIGTKVQSCHPEKSIHLVNQILADFKAGKRDVAEFWIDFQGMKVHIRYFPVSSPAGDYIGCLEVVQDVAAIQKLSGERRLLDEA